MTLPEAEQLARRCAYGQDAIEQPGTEINWADAGAFFLEGYLHAQSENILRDMKASVTLLDLEEQLKHVRRSLNSIARKLGREMWSDNHYNLLMCGIAKALRRHAKLVQAARQTVDTLIKPTPDAILAAQPRP